MTDAPLCARCMRDDLQLMDAPCAEKPEAVFGPIGMYHCPDCGAMVLAGMLHPPLCTACIEEMRNEHGTAASGP